MPRRNTTFSECHTLSLAWGSGDKLASRSMTRTIVNTIWGAAGIVVSEFLGYILHRLLHSGRIAWLSQSHMIHHLVLYGPWDPMRPGVDYRSATEGRARLGNVGLEWLVPGAAMLGTLRGVFSLMRVPRGQQITFFTTSLLWSFVVFSYLHDRMHEKGFWMEGTPVLRRWFLRARDFHDIHHMALNNDGLMDRNFGIGFFVFDRLFGTRSERCEKFNENGYERALQRFAKVVGTEKKYTTRVVAGE
jgi:sterol desaturase/sphingolipid hydroxylase (fatty acid hydroxylase superfamily)